MDKENKLGRKVAVVIGAWNPPFDLIETIDAACEEFDHVFVIDDGSGANADACYRMIKPRDNLLIERNLDNKGLGHSLNRGVSLAKQLKCKFLVTLDQDSKFQRGYVNSMLGLYDSLSMRHKVGVISPMLIDPTTGTVSKQTKLDKLVFRRIKCSLNDGWLEISLPVTSGSFYPLDVFEALGYFRSDFFIDYIDNEMSLRILKCNYKIFLNCQTSLLHKIGDRKVERAFLVPFRPFNHNPVRKYYATRNRLYTIAEYGASFPAYILFEASAILLDFTRIMLFENEKTLKMKYILYGARDFLKRRLGRLE